MAPMSVRRLRPFSWPLTSSAALMVSPQTVPGDTPAYASTVGAGARFQREYDGAQPGDPKKAGAAVLNIARLDEPPMRLLLGRDAVRAAAEAERTRAEADRKWRALSEATDFLDPAGPTFHTPSQSSSHHCRAPLKIRKRRLKEPAGRVRPAPAAVRPQPGGP